MRLGLFVLSLFSVWPLIACADKEIIKASRCIVVDLQGQSGLLIVPILEEYADAHHMHADMTDPGNYRFKRKVGGLEYYEIMYTMGMGPHGAILTVFNYHDLVDEDVEKQFDEDLLGRVSHVAETASCESIPGFSVPVMYRELSR